MRIAVPTNDGETLSAHFGKSAGFLVFEIADGRILSREFRANEACGLHAGGHDHGAMASVLDGCDVVLCGGMGRGAADALKAAGLVVAPVAVSGAASEIVAAYLAGSIKPASESFCGCRH